MVSSSLPLRRHVCLEPPSTNPRILSGYAPYADHIRSKGSAPTTEGRRQLLLDDPHARDVQPEQVTCTRCSKIVRLQKGKNYHLAHWLDHRWRCDRMPANPPPKAKSLNLLDRKAFLEADEDAKVVEPDRVLCGRCNREVKLRKGRAYGLSCWNKHKIICQMPAYISASSQSDLASPSIPHSGTEAHKYNSLTYNPPVASNTSQPIKCALCLAWLDIKHPKDIDVHVWQRHRLSYVVGNFTDAKPAWAPPRFFRPHIHFSASGSEMIDTRISDSSDSDNLPHSQRTPLRSRTVEAAQDETYIRKMPHFICAAESPPSPSLSPPSLSSSILTSSDDSVASTPLSSPRRGPSLFPNSRLLPVPTNSISRAQSAPKKHARDEHEIRSCALELHRSSIRSVSPVSDRSSRPPPYLERTPLSLPVPKGYWRYESVE